MNKKFENKSNIVFGNILLIGLIIFTFMVFTLFYYSTGPVYETIFMLLSLFMLYVFFTRFTSRVEFTADFCYITTPPFFKHKHKIKEMTFIEFKQLYFIKFNESFYKIPFYMVTLDNIENEKLLKYIKGRDDIKVKII